MKKLSVLFILTLAQLGLIAQCQSVVCFQNINISIDSQGQANMLPEIFTSGDHSQCDLEVALYDITNTDVILDFQDTLYLTCDHLGDFVVRVRDKGTGNTCFGQITLQDFQNACTTSTDDIAAELSYSLTNGILDIDLPAGVETDLHVYNVVGKLIMSQKISEYTSTVDMTVLEQKGVYIISAMINKKIRSKKVAIW